MDDLIPISNKSRSQSPIDLLATPPKSRSNSRPPTPSTYVTIPKADGAGVGWVLPDNNDLIKIPNQSGLVKYEDFLNNSLSNQYYAQVKRRKPSGNLYAIPREKKTKIKFSKKTK